MLELCFPYIPSLIPHRAYSNGKAPHSFLFRRENPGRYIAVYYRQTNVQQNLRHCIIVLSLSSYLLNLVAGL
jgi:hypothetical protein